MQLHGQGGTRMSGQGNRLVTVICRLCCMMSAGLTVPRKSHVAQQGLQEHRAQDISAIDWFALAGLCRSTKEAIGLVGLDGT
eukprot:scaffold89991_cov12-Tisochrysis_lutea.AAC.1